MSKGEGTPHGWHRQARAALSFTLLALVAIACGSSPAPPRQPPPGSLPGETFTAGDGTRFTVETLVSNLEVPWAMAFAPDGRLFVTERPGRVRIVENGQLVAEPALVLTDVNSVGEGGALGLALHPDFVRNHFVYLVYTAARDGAPPVNRLVRYQESGGRLLQPSVRLDDVPAAAIHNGSRLKFGPDRLLYMTMGDAATASVAQDVNALNGKILRVTDTGAVPEGNPFSSPVFSYGHRNPQGIDWDPVTFALWETEHGQSANDEVNIIEAGANYGWPEIEDGETRDGMRSPVLYFTQTAAPSGAAFYWSNRIPAFNGDFFFAALRGQHLHRVRLDSADRRRVRDQEALLQGRYGRLRDVVAGPDGALYFCTSNRGGSGTPAAEDDRILRIVPATGAAVRR